MLQKWVKVLSVREEPAHFDHTDSDGTVYLERVYFFSSNLPINLVLDRLLVDEVFAIWECYEFQSFWPTNTFNFPSWVRLNEALFAFFFDNIGTTSNQLSKVILISEAL